MADKPKETGDQDYNRRPFMQSDSFGGMMRRPTDKMRDNLFKLPHSEEKKPYRDDEYPEMEFYLTPWDPIPWDYPSLPDDPRIPIDPDIPGGEWEDPRGKDHKFLGCEFGFPAGPRVIKPGELTWVGLGVIVSDDPLVSVGVKHGPAFVLPGTDAENVNKCNAQGIYNCIINIQAFKASQINDSKYGRDGAGMFPVFIEGRTKSGATCSFYIWVDDVECPAAVPLEYDWDNSAETIADGANVQIFVLGGEGPYSWQVSGHAGFYLDRSVTTGPVNKLFNDEACGSATITITDACGEVVSGFVRSTFASGWYPSEASVGTDGCVLPGGTYTLKWKAVFAWNYELILGKYWQKQVVDVDACDLDRNYYGYATYAEAEAKCIEVIGTCENHCLNDLAGCSDYCGSPRSTHCYACLNWDPIWPSYPGFNLYGDGWGVGKYYDILGSAPNFACSTRCFCTSHQRYHEWVCS